MRTAAVWCATVLAVAGMAGVAVSDVALRDGRPHPGTDPHSWDLVGTILLVAGVIVVLHAYVTSHREYRLDRLRRDALNQGVRIKMSDSARDLQKKIDRAS